MNKEINTYLLAKKKGNQYVRQFKSNHNYSRTAFGLSRAFQDLIIFLHIFIVKTKSTLILYCLFF